MPDLAPIRLPSGIDPRIEIFRVPDEVDVFVVHTRRFTALIDTTGTPSQCRQILEAIADPARQLIVVNTHADWDHVWGNAAIGDRGPIVAHEAAASRLRSAEATETLQAQRTASERFAEVELAEPTVTFRDSLALHGGDLTLHLLHTPGHTDDHVAVWLPELRTCIAGDAAEDPIPEVTEPTARNLRLLCESLRRLHDLRPEHVLPSHGETSSPELLRRNLAYFTTVAERVRSLPVAEPAADTAPGLRFEDCVPEHRELTPAMLEFYRRCHRKAVRATALQARRRDG